MTPRNPTPSAPSDADRRPLVLHVRTVSGRGGGPDKTILRSPAAIDASRYRMEIAAIHPAGESIARSLREEASRHGCVIHLIGESHSLDLRTVWRLAKLCRGRGVNIWHAHDHKSNLLGLLLREVHPMKLVTTAHGWVDKRFKPKLWLYEQIDQYCLGRYDRVIAVSDTLARHCRELGVEPDRLSTIHNGIDPGEWRWLESKAQARWELDLPDDALILGSASRLTREKGIDRLLPVLGKLHRRLPNLRYLVIGEGPAEPALRQQAEALGLGEVVIWAGWRKPLHRWYRAMDALVMPSRTEGLPNTLLEAMAMGVPVAATDVGGIGTLLDHGRCGLLLAQDAGQWEAELEKLLTDNAWRQDLISAAGQRIGAEYSFSRRMRRVAGCYDQLAEGFPQTCPVLSPCQQAA